MKGGLINSDIITTLVKELMNRFKKINKGYYQESFSTEDKLASPESTYARDVSELIGGLDNRYKPLPLLNWDQKNDYTNIDVVFKNRMYSIKEVRYEYNVEGTILKKFTSTRTISRIVKETFKKPFSILKKEFKIDNEIEDILFKVNDKDMEEKIFTNNALSVSLKKLDKNDEKNIVDRVFTIESEDKLYKFENVSIKDLTIYKYDKVIFVSGLGCSIQEYTNKYLDELSNRYNLPFGITDEICHNLDKTLEDILSLWIKNTLFLTNYVISDPLTNNSAFNDHKEKIKEYLRKGKRVLLVGFSFGGAVVNKLAMDLNVEEPNERVLQNLTCYSCSSIFVAPFSKINKINITNFLLLGDVAQKLNGQYEPLPEKIDSYNKCVKYTHQFRINDNKQPNSSVKWIDVYDDDNSRFLDKKRTKLLELKTYTSYLDANKYLGYIQDTVFGKTNILSDTVTLLTYLPSYLIPTVVLLLGTNEEWEIHNMSYVMRCFIPMNM